MALLARLILFSVLSVTVFGNGFEQLNHIKPKASPASQADAAQELIKRLLPSRAGEFKVIVIPDIGPANLDTYQILSDGTTVTITGTTGVAVTWGLQHYLKHYCSCHISWNGDQLHLPPPGKLPIVNPALKITSPNRFRYYQNVCTVSYTFAFWNWTRWERHIDWMALNGINLPLAFNGQEAIWQKVYLKMGFKQEDLDTHFGGPAFLAWARMGNMHGWGGPLPQSWHQQQLALQHQILQRMRSLGMIPVLPAFAGHVPKAMKVLYPNASISDQSDWGSFSPEYCCEALLDPQDPLFQPIGKAFIEAMMEEFNGTDHIYNGDTFNEMNPKSPDPAYLANCSRGVYDAIQAADPHGVWLMQGWLFNSGFWKPTLIKALLQAVPIGRMIVLDLGADAGPIYSRTESFYGQPFIWCLLHNFGGQNGLFGHLDIINTGPFTARAFPNSTMIGMGITPEGILQNTVVYNFYNDMTWRSNVTNVTEWIMDYPTRRYGMQDTNVQMAWLTLGQTVYNSTQNTRACEAVVQPPVLTRGCAIWYNYTKVQDAWNKLLQAPVSMQSSSLYRYDLVDVTRNTLQDIGYYVLKNVVASFENKEANALRNNGTWLTSLILDMDNITSSHADWLLGPWLEAAKSFATTDIEAELYEYNQRMQITLWGPKGEVLDYAAKQWGTMLKTYYYVRWELFVNYLSECLYQNKTYSQDEFNARSFVWEESWAYDRSFFPTTPTGDTIDISRSLYNKYEYFRPAEIPMSPTDHVDAFGSRLKSGISHQMG